MGLDRSYVFPAIRGVQANQEYYVTMLPLRLIPRIISFDDEELVPEIRAQRTLNKARIPEMSRYMIENRDNYVFSAITVSIDSPIHFNPMGNESEERLMGMLNVPMSARFVINDGQHRRAAIEMALKDNPELGDESIAVVFFLDKGLERCQQMFADLNRYAIRPSKSLSILYDHRDHMANIAKYIAFQASAFKDLVEMERSTLSLRSRKLFTLSAIYSATSDLLNDVKQESYEESTEIGCSFWNEIGKQFPEWEHVRQGKMLASEIRTDCIHSHGIALQSIGRVGNYFLINNKKNWKSKIKQLKTIDWARSNAALWEGRAMIGGRLSRTGHNIILTTNGIKNQLGIELNHEEKKVEKAFLKGEHGKKVN